MRDMEDALEHTRAGTVYNDALPGTYRPTLQVSPAERKMEEKFNKM